MSTVIIYTIKDDSDYRFGRPAQHVLRNPRGQVDGTWVKVAEYELPDGYALAVNWYNDPIITYDGQACDLVSDKDDQPVIQYTDTRQYAPPRVREPLVKIRDVDLVV